ncbi:OLC1v1018732C1 [Oldenlandia corymbosa var. corymbosa]|uniref:OLC1v1018732C1 n=1 Tax=Oldenlandia corymbosa var. corymbosa TaxID=529605 RepID=A0AAV1ECH4_OLDCO|nr:OLC1v1018732C1 [Oldenlandia corymbosa var. corymbosa]
MAGIYDLLKFCTIGLGKSRDLVEAVQGFWSGSSNVFCFLWGPMTPTLLDVCVITSLPAVADVAVDGNVTNDDAIAAVAGQPRSYGPFINENKGHTSRLHHIRFLAMWLNMYVFPGKLFQMTMDWYHVTGRLASGVQINLAEAILAMLYHCLHEARHNPVATFCGPVFKTVFESNPNIEASVLSHDWWHKSFEEGCHAEAESGKWDNNGRPGREKLTMAQYTTHWKLMDLRGRSAATIPFNFCFNATPGFTDWRYELSIGMYGSGYEAIKTSFGIGKFAKNKAVGGVAEAKKKGKGKSGAAAKTGGQSSKKSTATAAVKAKTSVGKNAPTSTRRSKRLIGRKRSASEVSNKENPVSVSESEEEEAESPGSEKGSITVAEDHTAQKTVLETSGARSKKIMKTASSSTPTASRKKALPSLESLKAKMEQTKAAAYVKTEETSRAHEMPLGVALQQITEMFQLPAEETAYGLQEKNKLLSEQLIEQAGQLETNIKEAIAAETKAKEELEKAQAKRKQLEAELSGVVADTDVAIDGYGRMTTVVNQLLPKFQDAEKIVEGAQTSWNFLKNTITKLTQEVGTGPNSPMPVSQTPRSHSEGGATAEERQTTSEMPQDVPPHEEEALDVAPLASRPATSPAEI